jgi:diguanylate cyclase (GGDEF)-like protein
VLVFTDGVRQFAGHARWPRPRLLGPVAAFAAVDLTAILAGSPLARHLWLNAGLAAIWGVLAVVAAVESRRLGDMLQAPMRAVAVMIGGLSLLTGARALHLLRDGPDVLFAGPVATVFYVYASLTALLLCPLLLWMVFVRMNLGLAELVSRDALTRVLNRHGLDDRLHRHFGLRRQEPLCFLQVDIDHFKRINDERGHAAGDATLRAVALCLELEVRAEDFVARTGGEEFLVACVGASQSIAQALAERLRRAVAELRVPAPDGGEPLHCTVSVGVSQPFAALTAWELAAREADAALYRAKSAGRDRVEVAA